MARCVITTPAIRSTYPTLRVDRTPIASVSASRPVWRSDREMVHAAYSLHAEDDDWSQPGTLVRYVFDDAARERLLGSIVGHLLKGVSEPVLQRSFEYWRNVDKVLGDKIEAGVRAEH